MVKKLKKLLNIYGYWNTLAPTSADGHGTMIRDARQFNNMWSKRFRRNTLLAVTQDYCKAMPPSAAIEKMSFEEMKTILQDKTLIDVTKCCIKRIHSMCVALHPMQIYNETVPSFSVKEFLLAFLFRYWSAEMFECIGDQETKLQKAAVSMLDCLEQVLVCIMERRALTQECSLEFPTLLYDYFRLFKSWKIPDESSLISRIRQSLWKLYEQAETGDMSGTMEIERLRIKLSEIAGDTALVSLDLELQEKKIYMQAAGWKLESKVPMEVLVHELRLDTRYRVVPFDTIHKTVCTVLDSEFWAVMLSNTNLQPHPCFAKVQHVFDIIEEGLLNLTKQNVTDVFERTKHKIIEKTVTLVDCQLLFHQLFETLHTVQSEAQRYKTQVAWMQVVVTEVNQYLCEGLRVLHEELNQTFIDTVNNRLEQLMPMVATQGLNYETTIFNSKLKKKSITLLETERWLRLATESATGTMNVVHEAFVLLLEKDDLSPETLRLDMVYIQYLRKEYESLHKDGDHLRKYFLCVLRGQEITIDSTVDDLSKARISAVADLLLRIYMVNVSVYLGLYSRILEL